jgi:hypothetical protein
MVAPAFLINIYNRNWSESLRGKSFQEIEYCITVRVCPFLL